MIKLTDRGDLWIGNSADGTNFPTLEIRALLNVAHDLQGKVVWPEVEYVQVGLVDGPGNPPEMYCAAVLALSSLLRKGHRTLVCCHTGSRSMATCIMYMEATDPGRGWDGWVEILSERVPLPLPVPDPTHKSAFESINWKTVSRLMSKQ